jgi:excisionase family DNA binding protein
MALLSVSEAAKLVGKSVKTIYRHIDTGKLSFTRNDNGAKSIDTSELVRVYGKFKSSNENVIDSHLTQHENPHDNGMTNLLRQENELLKEILKEKEAHIDSLKQAMLLLEHRKEEPTPSKKGWLAKLF